jgi:hypothetical protein
MAVDATTKADMNKEAKVDPKAVSNGLLGSLNCALLRLLEKKELPSKKILG